MAFTDRFIEVPIKVFNSVQKELTGKEEVEDTWMKINPFEIASYRPALNDEYADPEDAIILVLKGGDTTTVYLPIKEFEKLLDNHQG